MNKQLADELHSGARRNFPRRRVIVKSIDDLFETDLIDMSKYSRQNKGFKFILVLINCFSKFVWVRPLKSKGADDVVCAMNDILKSIKYKPSKLNSDHGKEYYNSKFKALMHKYKIHHFSTYSVIKASMAERYNRTLKGQLWKHFTSTGTFKYIDVLQKLVDSYNSSVHRTTGLKPKFVTRRDQKYLLKHVYKTVGVKTKPKLKRDDLVRISKYKHLFDKGYTANWTTELFKVVKVDPGWPVTYKLQDLSGENILGSFYEPELLKSKFKNGNK